MERASQDLIDRHQAAFFCPPRAPANVLLCRREHCGAVPGKKRHDGTRDDKRWQQDAAMNMLSVVRYSTLGAREDGIIT
jgi:hypothetical protein